MSFLNWGTFDRHIWHIQPQGDNALLTGDIGSGKSTLVDALTTLLVPGQKITFNKAAGAETKERSLRSYVRGDYKSEKDNDNLSAKAVSLREKNSYSVLLGLFYHQGFDQWVALAQVFWLKAGQNNPERFYLLADRCLTIKANFSDFGKDILALKKRLRGCGGIKLYDSFSRYAAEFRRRMGINNEQALNLFYQTVSMKSVGNLTDFVRYQMLEALPVQMQIDSICREFDNLNQAHEMVLKAKAQIEALTPLVADAHIMQQRLEDIEVYKACRDTLYHTFRT